MNAKWVRPDVIISVTTPLEALGAPADEDSSLLPTKEVAEVMFLQGIMI